MERTSRQKTWQIRQRRISAATERLYKKEGSKMIKGALPSRSAFSIYSKAGIDCQPKMRKILGILLFYIFYEYIEWKCWEGRAGEKGWRVWSGFVGKRKGSRRSPYYFKKIYLSL